MIFETVIAQKIIVLILIILHYISPIYLESKHFWL